MQAHRQYCSFLGRKTGVPVERPVCAGSYAGMPMPIPILVKYVSKYSCMLIAMQMFW